MPLVSALPQLEKDIKEIMYEAAYKAMKCSQVTGKDTNAYIQTQLDEQLEKLANKFAEEFSDAIYLKLSDAIYNFVKEIGIMMTPSGTLIAPTMGGPVTGTALIQNFTIT